MSDWTARIVSLIACALAAAALGVSLAHAGPRGMRGPAGPQGPACAAAKAAQGARLGVCWSVSYQDDVDGDLWANSVSVEQPILQDGVYTCPQGETFVSVVPQAPTAGVNGG